MFDEASGQVPKTVIFDQVINDFIKVVDGVLQRCGVLRGVLRRAVFLLGHNAHSFFGVC